MISTPRSTLLRRHKVVAGEPAQTPRARRVESVDQGGPVASFVRVLAISVLVPVVLLAVVLLTLPEDTIKNPWVFLPLVAAVPVVGVAIRAFLVGRFTKTSRNSRR